MVSEGMPTCMYFMNKIQLILCAIAQQEECGLRIMAFQELKNPGRVV